MKATVVHSFSEPLSIEERAIPEPQPHQALIKVAARAGKFSLTESGSSVFFSYGIRITR